MPFNNFKRLSLNRHLRLIIILNSAKHRNRRTSSVTPLNILKKSEPELTLNET
jgi:hypothetical protein